MKILLFGKNGQVGWELNRSLLPAGEIVALDQPEADFSDPESLRKLINDNKPDVIVNAAAYTAVDKAEDEENLATRINGFAPGVLAEEAKKLNALLIHYSTDYVFDGTKAEAYSEGDEVNPLNAYGRSKLAGERAINDSGCDHVILRTSWVYASRGRNFYLSMLRLAKESEQLRIVDDQYGAPTWARLIADTTAHIIVQSEKEREETIFKSDIYHLVCKGCTTWFRFAESIFECVGAINGKNGFIIKSLVPVTSEQYPTKAVRPLNSMLSTHKIEKHYSIQLPSWKTALALCTRE